MVTAGRRRVEPHPQHPTTLQRQRSEYPNLQLGRALHENSRRNTGLHCARSTAFRGFQYPTLPSTAEVTLDHFHQIHRRVRRVRPSHAPLRIESIELVDVVANDTEKTITWETVAPPILLGGGRRYGGDCDA